MARPAANPYAVGEMVRSELNLEHTKTLDYVDERANVLAENAQTGTAYTLVLADAGKRVSMNNGSANTVTVPPNTNVPFTVGTTIEVGQIGAGQTSVAPGSGVTLNSESSMRKVAARYASVRLFKQATNTWVLEGALAA